MKLSFLHQVEKSVTLTQFLKFPNYLQKKPFFDLQTKNICCCYFVLFVSLFAFVFCFFSVFFFGWKRRQFDVIKDIKVLINLGDANQILAAIQLKMNLWFIFHIVFTSEQRDCVNFLNKLVIYLYLTLHTLYRKSGFSKNESLWKPCWNLKLKILSCILFIIGNISSFVNKNWNCLKLRCSYMY